MQMSWVLILEPCWPPHAECSCNSEPGWSRRGTTYPSSPTAVHSRPVHPSPLPPVSFCVITFISILFCSRLAQTFPPRPQTLSILFRRIRPTHTVTKPCLHSKTTPPTQRSKTSSQTRCCERKKMTKRAVDTISNNWAQLLYSHFPDALCHNYSQRTQISNCQWLVLLFKVSDSSG